MLGWKLNHISKSGPSWKAKDYIARCYDPFRSMDVVNNWNSGKSKLIWISNQYRFIMLKITEIKQQSPDDLQMSVGSKQCVQTSPPGWDHTPVG